MWKAKDKTSPYFYAESSAVYSSLLLGTHKWTIYNDSRKCEEAATGPRKVVDHLLQHIF